jgi:hypothetical protein
MLKKAHMKAEGNFNLEVCSFRAQISTNLRDEGMSKLNVCN